jgi:hypothetical protein
VVGDTEGDWVGSEVVGDIDGDTDGDWVGSEVVGEIEGDWVGSEVVGDADGDTEGEEVGETEGASVGIAVVGEMVGDTVGPRWDTIVMFSGCETPWSANAAPFSLPSTVPRAQKTMSVCWKQKPPAR